MTTDRASGSAGDALAGSLKRTEIQRAPLSIAGREIVQVRTEIPPGVESGWHIHPGEEVGYIVAGNVEMRIADRATLLLQAGGGLPIPPPGAPHPPRPGAGGGGIVATPPAERGEAPGPLTQPP